MGKKYIVVQWPEIQDYMIGVSRQDFEANCHLINDKAGVDEYGDSAYFVDEEWAKAHDDYLYK